MFKGKMLEEYLVREGLSYQRFGERVGLSRQMVMYLVRGLKQPSLSTLTLIAAEMGCKLDDLVE